MSRGRPRAAVTEELFELALDAEVVFEFVAEEDSIMFTTIMSPI
jgi:hypothetical protein